MQIGSLECMLLLAGGASGDRFASSVVIRKMRAGISPSDRPVFASVRQLVVGGDDENRTKSIVECVMKNRALFNDISRARRLLFLKGCRHH
jgi:hypothetical protein